MEYKKYESPKISFQRMKLLENIAERCWGYAYAWFDADRDGNLDEGEKVRLVDIGLGENGCQGNGDNKAQGILYKYFLGKFPTSGITMDDCAVNSKSARVFEKSS